MLVSPPSLDLAAHLLRAKLFSAEGFGVWNNWWYGGHHVPGYSVLFPPIAAALTPTGRGRAGGVRERDAVRVLARDQFGEDAWLGAAVVRRRHRDEPVHRPADVRVRAAARDRLRLALSRRRTGSAVGFGALTALASPVAALFAALGAAAFAIGRYAAERRLRAALPGIAVIAAALVPLGLLSLAFPEGGSEPFTWATLWPIPAISLVALVLLIPQREVTLIAGIVAVRARDASPPSRSPLRWAATPPGSAR